ncbi:hypothetical protein C8Q76DRAFT_750534 [Earliella scabrosa]|nr:hypothetical protein C8Q76DRAFT_750534 [Earliella scabrosa]
MSSPSSDRTIFPSRNTREIDFNNTFESDSRLKTVETIFREYNLHRQIPLVGRDSRSKRYIFWRHAIDAIVRHPEGHAIWISILHSDITELLARAPAGVESLFRRVMTALPHATFSNSTLVHMELCVTNYATFILDIQAKFPLLQKLEVRFEEAPTSAQHAIMPHIQEHFPAIRHLGIHTPPPSPDYTNRTRTSAETLSEQIRKSNTPRSGLPAAESSLTTVKGSLFDHFTLGLRTSRLEEIIMTGFKDEYTLGHPVAPKFFVCEFFKSVHPEGLTIDLQDDISGPDGVLAEIAAASSYLHWYTGLPFPSRDQAQAVSSLKTVKCCRLNIEIKNLGPVYDSETDEAIFTILDKLIERYSDFAQILPPSPAGKAELTFILHCSNDDGRHWQHQCQSRQFITARLEDMIQRSVGRPQIHGSVTPARRAFSFASVEGHRISQDLYYCNHIMS